MSLPIRYASSIITIETIDATAIIATFGTVMTIMTFDATAALPGPWSTLGWVQPFLAAFSSIQTN